MTLTDPVYIPHLDRPRGSAATKECRGGSYLREHHSAERGSPVFLADPEFRLIPLAGGEFRLEGHDGLFLGARPEGDARAIEGDRLPGRWYLREQSDERGCYVLTSGLGDQAQELGRTTRGPEGSREGGITYLLLGDGRLFRIIARGYRDKRLDLVSWETAGPYLSARQENSEYRIARTPAGGKLDGVDEIVVLFAAEILDRGASR